MDAAIVLADGRVFRGRAVGATGRKVSEIVFNTGLTGYQEILTDPSYAGQAVVFTCPHIGNYGVNEDDPEAERPWVDAIIVREACRAMSGSRGTSELVAHCERHGILVVEDVDTRALTRHLRQHGTIMGAIATDGTDPETLLEEVRAAPGMIGRDLVSTVTCRAAYRWTEPTQPAFRLHETGPAVDGWPVVVIDFGVKRNILRSLVDRGLDVTVVPATEPAEAILARHPRGIVLSNGPGDPAAVPHAHAQVRALLGQVPIFGICMGHQILGSALGGTTYKLGFGHRGANHPVKDLRNGRVAVTSQNHGFAVNADSLPASLVAPIFTSLNDGTLEGISHRSLPAFSVQYHPEANPGPHDTATLFDEFVTMMGRHPAKG